MKKCIYCFLLILAACGGGGGNSSGTAPQISNLRLAQNYEFFMAGGGTAFASAQLDFNDPDGDVTSLQIDISDGSSITVSVSAPGVTSGTIDGGVQFSTATRGIFTATVRAVDSGGRRSNALSIDFYIIIDTTNWVAQVSGSTANLEDVVWNGNQFLAVGSGGAVLTSPNGVVWTARVSGTTVSLYSAHWDGGRYLVGGDAGTLLSSPDGVVWTALNSSVNDVRIIAIESSPQIYVAGGRRSSFPVMLTSTDGQTWSENVVAILGLRSITGIAWSGQQFAASAALNSAPQDANIYTSTDGLTWVPVVVSTQSASLLSMVWADVNSSQAVGWDGCLRHLTESTGLRSFHRGRQTCGVAAGPAFCSSQVETRRTSQPLTAATHGSSITSQGSGPSHSATINSLQSQVPVRSISRSDGLSSGLLLFCAGFRLVW